MTTFKRETTRQGIIRECSSALVIHCGPSSEKTYRQNIHSVIARVIDHSTARATYYDYCTHNQRAIVMLHNAIARKAYYLSIVRNGYPKSAGFMLSVDHPLHYMSSAKIKRFD